MTDVLERGNLIGKDMNGVLWFALNDLARANTIFANVIADLMPSPQSGSEDGENACDLLEPTTRDVAEDVAVFASHLRYQAERMTDLVKLKDQVCGQSCDQVAPPPAKACGTKSPVNLPSPTGRVRR